MYISKKQREIVRNKFGGKCAYAGTELFPDWQVDHAKAVRRNWFLNNSAIREENHNIDNMIPAQRIVNHYKHSMDVDQFKAFMCDFHLRIAKLPKNPYSQASIKRKKYMLDIAELFEITPERPFSGSFYFETLTI